METRIAAVVSERNQFVDKVQSLVADFDNLKIEQGLLEQTLESAGLSFWAIGL